MHPLIPIALLVLGAYSQRKQQQAAPPAPAAPRAVPRQPPPPAARKAAKPPAATGHPDVMPAPASAQAAVDAVMQRVVAETLPPGAIVQQAKPAAAPPPVAPEDPDALARQQTAAKRLLAFLVKTGRFGNKADRPNEVRQAQAELNVTPDGIVGPKTRAATKAVGVALPPRK